MPGSYFYRPMSGYDPSGVQALGAGLAGGISRGAENYTNEKERVRQQTRQDKADQWQRVQQDLALVEMGGGRGKAPTDQPDQGEGPAPAPKLDFGLPGMEHGTQPHPSPLGPAGASLVRPAAAAPAAQHSSEPPAEAPPAAANRISDYLTTPSEAPTKRHFVQLGDFGYVRDPQEFAAEKATTAFQRQRQETDVLAKDAEARQSVKDDKDANELVPMLRRDHPEQFANASDADVLGAARIIVKNHGAAYMDLFRRYPDPMQIEKVKADSAREIAQIRAGSVVQAAHERAQGSGSGAMDRLTEVGRRNAVMSAMHTLNQMKPKVDPLTGSSSETPEQFKKRQDDFAQSSWGIGADDLRGEYNKLITGGKAPAGKAGGRGAGGPASAPPAQSGQYDDVRGRLQGYSEEDQRAALEDAGYSSEEIDAIVGGG